MRIIAGRLKGRIIPFDNSRFSNADVTSEKIKEALFSILGDSVTGAVLLDLFACSGQIGLEAFSRGASFIVLNELDRKRFNFIRKCADDWLPGDDFMVLNYHASRCIRYCKTKGIEFDYAYLDPPYDKSRTLNTNCAAMLDEISSAGIMKENGSVIFQHYCHNEMPGSAGNFMLMETRNYGSNSLSSYAGRQHGNDVMIT
jgi:16S rRNA (guanine966-N2)-methyltransferase